MACALWYLHKCVAAEALPRTTGFQPVLATSNTGKSGFAVFQEHPTRAGSPWYGAAFIFPSSQSAIRVDTIGFRHGLDSYAATRLWNGRFGCHAAGTILDAA